MIHIQIDDPESMSTCSRRALIAFLSCFDASESSVPTPGLPASIKAIDLSLGVKGDDGIRNHATGVSVDVTRLPSGDSVVVIKPAGTIAAADNPATGSVPIPSVPAAPAVAAVPPVPPVPGAMPTAGDPDAPRQVDAASIGFGGTPTTGAAPVPSVPPIPPVQGAGAPLPTDTPPGQNASPPDSAQAAIAGVPPAGVVLDSKGLPWDGRIHATTKGMNADGGWKKRKNTAPELIASVEAELRKLMAIPGPAGSTAAAAGGVPLPPAVPPVPGAVPQPPAAVDPDALPATFASLMGWVTKAVALHQLTQAEVAESVKPHELQSITHLATRPDLIPLVYPGLLAIVQARRLATTQGA